MAMVAFVDETTAGDHGEAWQLEIFEERLPLREVFRRADRFRTESQAGAIGQLDADELLGFLADRLKVALREQGVRHDLIAAVFALGGEDDFVRLLARVEALAQFLRTEDGAHLLTAQKRAANILRICRRCNAPAATRTGARAGRARVGR